MKIKPFPSPASFTGKIKSLKTQQLEELSAQLIATLKAEWDGGNGVNFKTEGTGLQEKLRERLHQSGWATQLNKTNTGLYIDAAADSPKHASTAGIPTPKELREILEKQLAPQIRSQSAAILKSLQDFDGSPISIDLQKTKIHPFSLAVISKELEKAGWNVQPQSASPTYPWSAWLPDWLSVAKDPSGLSIYPDPNKHKPIEID